MSYRAEATTPPRTRPAPASTCSVPSNPPPNPPSGGEQTRSPPGNTCSVPINPPPLKPSLHQRTNPFCTRQHLFSADYAASPPPGNKPALHQQTNLKKPGLHQQTNPSSSSQHLFSADYAASPRTRPGKNLVSDCRSLVSYSAPSVLRFGLSVL